MGYEQLPRELQECLDPFMKVMESKKLSAGLNFAINIKSIKRLKEFLKSLDEEALEIVKKKFLEKNPTNKVVNDEIVSNDEEALEIAKKKFSEQNPTNKVVNDEMVSNAKKIVFDQLCKEAFITKAPHRIFYQRTPLELCIYHYNQCSDYQSKSEEAKKVTKDVKEALDSSEPDTKDFWDYTKGEDFKIAKEFIETILNSARENEILEDVLTASGIRKDLAKRLSYEKHSNDVIINILQKNQKAEEMSTILQKNQKAEKMGIAVGITSLVFILPSLTFACKKYSEIGTGWSIAIGIVGAIVAACTIGYGTYKLFQPNTQMLATDANQKVGSKLPCKAESSIVG